MKKSLIILLFFIPFIGFSQQADSSQAVTIEQLKQGMIEMRTNLAKSHIEFNRGVAFTISGVLIGVGGAYLFKGDMKYNEPSVILGSALCFVGSVLMIDSHKFIGRAGRWEFSPESIKYNLTQK